MRIIITIIIIIIIVIIIMIIIIIIIILIKKPTRAPEVPRVDVWWGLANRLMARNRSLA